MDRKQPKPTNFCAYFFYKSNIFNYYPAQNGPDDGLSSQKL